MASELIERRAPGVKNPKVGFTLAPGLKVRSFKAAREAQMTLSEWIRHALVEKLERDGHGRYPL